MSNRNAIEQQLITARFVTQWVPRFPNLPVKYENRNFTPPVNEPWVAFSLRSGRVQEAAIGAIMPRGIGITYLQVFMPENAGTLVARKYVDAFADVFDEWHFVYPAQNGYPTGDFWFRRVEVVPSPIRDGWVQWTASVEFKHDEHIVELPPPPAPPIANVAVGSVTQTVNERIIAVDSIGSLQPPPTPTGGNAAVGTATEAVNTEDMAVGAG